MAVSIGACLFWFDSRMDSLETDQLLFKGAMSAKIDAMSNDMDDIKGFMQLLLNKLELDDGKTSSQIISETSAKVKEDQG